MNRQPGYYWVKYDGQWIVAELFELYYKKHWRHSQLSWRESDAPFEEINEIRIPMPGDHIDFVDSMAQQLGITKDQLLEPIPEVDPEVKARYEKMKQEESAMREHCEAFAAAIMDEAKNGKLLEFKPNGDPAKLWEMAVEATKQKVRSVMDHCEYDIEYKSDVNHEYLDIEKLLDKVDVENPFEEDSHPLSDKLQAMFENAAERAAKGEITFVRKTKPDDPLFAPDCTVSAGFSFGAAPEPVTISPLAQSALNLINASFPDALDSSELEIKEELESMGIYSKYHYAK